jgi:hypothetical protein
MKEETEQCNFLVIGLIRIRKTFRRPIIVVYWKDECFFHNENCHKFN